LGAVSSYLSARFNRRMLKASGVLVLALGLVMFTRGLNLFGVSLPSLPVTTQASGIAVATVLSRYQEVRTTVEASQYHPFVVQAGIPVRWTINVKAEELNGCNNPLTVPQFGIRKQLVPGDNLIEFTPDRVGTIVYTCWMGMVSSSIRVVADVTKLAPGDLSPKGSIASAFDSGQSGQGSNSANCCGGATSGRSAGGKVPVDSIGIAQIVGDSQTAEVTVSDNGYTPAVIVLQKGVKAKIRFKVGRLSGCNSIVSFPEYQGSLSLAKGQLETPYLEVTQDFGFQCGMGMLHGYVRVVDDISRVDLNAVRKTVAAYQPSSSGSSSCCGN
jgi:uncharacterized protein